MIAPRLEPDERLLDWLAVYDQALASGSTETHGPPPALDAAQRERLTRLQACVRRLHNLRRADGTAARDTPHPALADTLLPSAPLARLGRFEVRQLLGGGGFGLVYLAYDGVLRREVAVKVPRPEAMLTPQARQRFLREGQTAAALDHPNLVKVLEVGEAGAVAYLVSEYCAGPTLEAWLSRRDEPLTPAETAGLLVQLADGVAYMHRQGVLHRDLKPANILLQNGTADERRFTQIENQESDSPSLLCVHPRSSAVPLVPRITDFGLAKDVQRATQLTQSGTRLGTPRYMAPEQAVAGNASADAAVGPATDVYALGAILYELLTGRPPFVGGSDLDVLRQLVQEEPLAPRRLRADTPGDLETICLKCLEKEPARRYASAEQLADDLDRFQRGEPVRARPIGPLTRGWRWCRRNRAVAALLATVAVVLVGGASVSSVLAVVANQQTDLARRKATDEEGARKKAEWARDRTFQALDAMTSRVTGDSLETQPALSAEQKKFLAEVLTYYQEFAGEQRDDEETRKRIAAARRVGSIHYRLGDREAGVRAFEQARDAFTQLVADFPAEPQYRHDLAGSCQNLEVLLRERGQLPQAAKAYGQTLALQEQLAADFPAVPAYRTALAGSQVNYGILLHDRGQAAEALAWYDRAIALLKPQLEAEPRLVLDRQFLRNAYESRATGLDMLARFAEAAADWDRTVDLSSVSDKGIARAGRARSFALAGQVERAVAEAADLAKASESDRTVLYNLAGVYAFVASKDEANREGHVQSALGLLRRAVAKDFKNAEHMQKEGDLKLLRDHAEFRSLLDELRAKPQPKP